MADKTQHWLIWLFILCGHASLTHGSHYGSLQLYHEWVNSRPQPPESFETPFSVAAGKNYGNKMDTALLTVSSSIHQPITLWGQSQVCWNCKLLKMAYLPTGTLKSNVTLRVDTQYAISMYFNTTQVTTKPIHTECSLQVHFVQYGMYELLADPGCSVPALTGPAPPDSNIPIYVAMAVFFGAGLLWILLKYLYRKNYMFKLLFCFEHQRFLNKLHDDLGEPHTSIAAIDPDAANHAQVAPPQPKTRIQSLDAFRGISITVMILVNYGGGKYWFFRHSRWNGLTVADLVFPWFVFIMGTSIALSFKGMLRRSTPRYRIALKVIRRTITLFGIGIFLNSGHNGPADLTNLRIPGVLQRLAATYFLVAMTEVFFAKADDPHQYKWWAPVRDILPFWPEWLAAFLLLAVHLLLTFLLPIEGCPKGYLGPGGLHAQGQFQNCTGGAAGIIDRHFFGVNHIYPRPTSSKFYQSNIAYDPEGILGTFTSAFLCFLGLQAGKVLLIYSDWVSRTKRWTLMALLTGAAAMILCKMSRDDGWIPINKNFWSLSFVLAMGATGYALFTICYILIDVLQWWSGAPFIYPGMNSILIYMCHEVLKVYFPIAWKVPSDHASLLARELWGTVFWVIVSYILYHKKIFVTI